MRPVQPTNRMGSRPGMQRMAARRNAGPSPVQSQPETVSSTLGTSMPTTFVQAPNPMPGYKKGGKVKGYKNGGCVMGKRGVRNTKMM